MKNYLYQSSPSQQATYSNKKKHAGLQILQGFDLSYVGA